MHSMEECKDKYSCRKESQKRVTEKDAGRTKLRHESLGTKARAPTHTRLLAGSTCAAFYT